MKLLKKLSEDSNLVLFLFIFPLILLLVSFVLNVKDGNFYVLAFRIPISIGKNFFVTINSYLLGFLITMTTYITLILYCSIKEKKVLLIFGFPFYFFIILYLSVFISIGYIPFIKTFIFMYLNITIMFTFLLFLDKLFKSMPLASLIILFIQLMGGGVLYLYEFSEMFQSKVQMAVKIIYSILPFYQKTLNVYQNNEIQFLYFNVIFAGIIIVYQIYINFGKDKKN